MACIASSHTYHTRAVVSDDRFIFCCYGLRTSLFAIGNLTFRVKRVTNGLCISVFFFTRYGKTEMHF